MGKDCLNCIFALEHREHIREGEQVRCGKAEELFGTQIKGGKRWVNVLKSEQTGKVLKAKCGQFKPLVGDDFSADSVKTVSQTAKVNKVCSKCHGAGMVNVKVMARTEAVKCNLCNGKGKISA